MPRLIGKGGETIKRIQRENDVQIQISKDRQSRWIEVTISGSTEKVIENAFNHIKNTINSITPKNRIFKSTTFPETGSSFYAILYLLDIFMDILDTSTNQTTSSRFSKSNQFNSTDTNERWSAKLQNNVQNNSNIYACSTNSNFNPQTRTFTGMIILVILHDRLLRIHN